VLVKLIPTTSAINYQVVVDGILMIFSPDIGFIATLLKA
jgi:hypothetical protein